MKLTLRYSAIILSFLVGGSSFGQTIDTIRGCDDIPTAGFESSCSICNYNMVYGNTFGFTQSPDAGWCGTVENDQYIGFLAGTTGLVEFEIQIFNCENDNGVQVGIYDQSNNPVGDCFNQIVPGTPQLFIARDLTPGTLYYIRIDGFAGDNCEFNIQVISGLVNAGPGAPGPISGPSSVCWDEEYQYTIPSVQNASGYFWRITPGPYTTGASINPPNATDPNIGTTQLTVDVSIPIANPSMPLGTCDQIILSVIPLNQCFASTDSSTFVIEVCRSNTPPDTILTSGTYLHCEAGYTYPSTGITYNEGVHYFTNIDGVGQQVCEEIVALTVDRIGSPLVIEVIENPISCGGNGYIDLDISGGVTPYTFSWSNGNTTSSPTNLDSGLYNLTILDSLGCALDTTIRVRHISELQVPVFTNGTDCDGFGGAAFVDTSQIENYQIEWSTGETGTFITNLTTGRYGVSILDTLSGCRVDSFFDVGVLPACYSTISGRVVSDQQIDCQNPGSYEPLRGVMVECSNGENVFTDIDGNYNFQLDVGTYSITVPNFRPTSLLPVCMTNYTVTVNANQQTFANRDFFFERTNNPDIALVMVKQSPSRARVNTLNFRAINFNSTSASFSVTLNYSDLQTFEHSNPQHSSIDLNANTVTWNITDLESYEDEQVLVTLRTKVSTMVGDTVMYMLTTDSITTSIDVVPIDNELSCKAVVKGSYDPNDKLVTPIGQGEEGIIKLSDNLLQYTIRFQNTGSDDARYVRLEDVISDNLDISTMKVIGASHDYQANFNEDRNLNVVFDPIVLPPAMTDSLGSQGYFSFTIETTGDLQPNDRIENTAAIYFDFNDPIITNTAVNTIESISSIKEVKDNSSFVIFPNPNQGDLTVLLKEEQLVKSMHLISIDGRVLPALDFQGSGKQYKINLKKLGLAQGMYTLRLTLASGETTHQLFVFKQ